MELRIFSKNYYLKLTRLPLFKARFYHFGLILLISLVVACSPKEESVVPEPPKDLEVKVIDFHEDGKPKSQEFYYLDNGIRTIYGYEELYSSGKKKITGLYNKSHKRNGLWESFYESGSPWSTGGYSSGIENGEKKVWYPNGNLRYEGEMKDGKPFGTWSFWDKEGIKSIKQYE